jgi:hypothetical protein
VGVVHHEPHHHNQQPDCVYHQAEERLRQEKKEMMEVHPAISPFSPSRFLLSMPDRACSLQSVVVKKGKELLFSPTFKIEVQYFV